MATTERELANDLYLRLRQLIASGEWESAAALLNDVRHDRPWWARLVAQMDFLPHGNLIWICLGNVESLGFCRLLFMSGADPNLRDPAGVHILLECMRQHSSTRASNHGIFVEVLRFGANPNAVGDLASGRSLLHVAILDGRAEFVESLLRYGANPLEVADTGHDAFTLAKENGCKSILAILESTSADEPSWLWET